LHWVQLNTLIINSHERSIETDFHYATVQFSPHDTHNTYRIHENFNPNYDTTYAQRLIKSNKLADANETFSGRQPGQDVRLSDVLRTNSVPIFEVCWWFGSTKTDDYVSYRCLIQIVTFVNAANMGFRVSEGRYEDDDLPSPSSGNLTAGNDCEFNGSPMTAIGVLNPHETRLEVITAILIKIHVSWVITSRITVNNYRRFGGRALSIFTISQLSCYYIR
jgi:hypothetical protein